jgi:hypothetical protein
MQLRPFNYLNLTLKELWKSVVARMFLNIHIPSHKLIEKNAGEHRMNRNMSEVMKAAIIGGVMGLIPSFLINYFLLPMPETVLANAIGNGISGLISGFMGGFMGLLVYFKQMSKAMES